MVTTLKRGEGVEMCELEIEKLTRSPKQVFSGSVSTAFVHDICIYFLYPLSSFCVRIFKTIIAELRRPKGPPSGAPYSYKKEKETDELIFMVIMASGIAHGRVHTTAATATESCKMVAILQLIG